MYRYDAYLGRISADDRSLLIYFERPNAIIKVVTTVQTYYIDILVINFQQAYFFRHFTIMDMKTGVH